MTEFHPAPIQVLFLGEANSARSVMAEAITNRIGRGRFRAFSAGVHPRGDIHPRAVEVMQKNGFPADGLRPRRWEEFVRADAPALDFVFAFCGEAADEPRPTWPGDPMVAHWSIPDPLAATGTEAEVGLAFADAFRVLNNRIGLFTNLPIESLSRLAADHHL